MTSFLKSHALWFLLATAPPCLAALPLDSVVMITSRAAGTADLAMGAGTLISADGDVLTAYHVVQGAKSITVSTRQKQSFTDITVVKWDVQRDLAVLHINSPAVALTPYPLADPAIDIEPGAAEAYGHSATFYFSQFPAAIIHTPILSGQIRDTAHNNRQIFALNSITLIPIDLTIFGGLSGGPLVFGDRVIGVISGSLLQGGSIAWAIPVTSDTLDELESVGKPPEAISWPALALMPPGSSLVRAQVALGTDLAMALDNANEAMHPLDRSLQAMEQACRFYRVQLYALVQQADQQIAIDPAELVDSFTADATQAPAWGAYVNASSDCFQKLNVVNTQVNLASQAAAAIGAKFIDVANQFPDTPANEVVDDKMAAQGQENMAAQLAINADIDKFKIAIAAIPPAGNTPIAQAKNLWIASDAAIAYIVPEGQPGIMRRNHELQAKIVAQLELIFQLEGAS